MRLTMEFRILNGNVQFLFVLLFASPPFASSECVFGADNVVNLALRNQTILNLMNKTLFSFTTTPNSSILKISNFDLWNHLQTFHSITPQNYLQFVTSGGLDTIDWENETYAAGFTWDNGKAALLSEDKKIWLSNATGLTYLPDHINENFVTPIGEALQNITSTYSFSYGIYRPTSIQMNYAGLLNTTTGTDLDPTCVAGSYFNLQLPTNLSASNEFYDTYGLQFAKLATMIDTAFDAFYRNSGSILNKDLVRVNVISASTNDEINVNVEMEVYFINDTFDPNFILDYTIRNLAYLQPMIFMNATEYPFKVSILSNNVANITVNSYVNSITTTMEPTTEPPTTTEPSTAVPTTTETTTLEPTTAVPTTLEPTTIVPTTQPTTTRLTTQSTTHPTTKPSSTASSTTLAPTTTSRTTSSSTFLSTLLPSTTITSSTLLATNATITTNIANTSTSITTPRATFSTSSSVPSSPSQQISTTGSSQLNASASALSTNTANITNSPFLGNVTVLFNQNLTTSKGTLNGSSQLNASASALPTNTANITNSPFLGNITVLFNQNLTTSKGTLNGSISTLPPTTKSGNGSLIKPTKSAPNNFDGSNEASNLPSLMTSLMADPYFYSITIPTIAALIIMIFGCMAICHIDCLPKSK